VEVEGKLQLTRSWSLSAAVQHVKATFTEGPNAGREIILVPTNTANLRANWNPGSRQSASVGVRYASEQRFGNDFANSCTNRIPSYAVLDARYAWRTGPWEFAATGTNLTDRSYYSNAFSCTVGNIYPEAGRQVRLSARLDF
jgi:iron complex outermembrane receptor protein